MSREVSSTNQMTRICILGTGLFWSNKLGTKQTRHWPILVHLTKLGTNSKYHPKSSINTIKTGLNLVKIISSYASLYDHNRFRIVRTVELSEPSSCPNGLVVRRTSCLTFDVSCSAL